MIRFKEVSDIFEVAVRIERHSVELYVELYRTVSSSRAKEVFSALAAEEEKHLGQFRVLLQKSADYEPRYAYPGEYELFVDGTARRALESFHDMTRDVRITTAPEALTLAADLERGKISLYSEAAGQFAAGEREVIEELIAEERSHLDRLEDLLDTYSPEKGGREG